MSAHLDGSRIARLRKQKGWSQQKLADAADMDPSVVSRLERGMQDDFKFSIVLSIAAALGVSVDNLLDQKLVSNVEDLTEDLQSVIAELVHHPETVQKQVAGMIRGFLQAIKDQE